MGEIRSAPFLELVANRRGRVDTVSAVTRHGPWLYVGTLTGDAILRVPIETA